MAFQLSPGVNVSEIDLTTVIPSVSTTAGAIVGEFEWGPANKRILVDSEITLVDRFGKPSANVAATTNSIISFFTAANFLAYGNNLRVVRAANTGSNNATSNTTARTIHIANEDIYEQQYYPIPAFSSGGTTIFARYPGDLGNSIGVSILGANSNTQLATAITANLSNWTATTNTNTTIQFSSFFGSLPGTSAYSSSLNVSNDEIHIVVFDTTGKISGTAGTVLEVYPNLSVNPNARLDDGTVNYYPEVIKNQSKYIYIGQHLASNWGTVLANSQSYQSFGGGNSVTTLYLTNGNSVAATADNYSTGWDLFANGDEVDVSLLVGGAASEVSVATQQKVLQIASNRKDCVAFISANVASVVNNAVNTADDIVNYRNSLNRSTSYGVMDGNWKYQFDKYNNTYRWIPLNGDIAGLCVNTDNVRDPWWSPAGFNRGAIKNVVKLAWNPSKTDRDVLYSGGVNPVAAFPGDGIVLFGDKTLQAKPSAFDRINVRRLFIVLEKAIAVAAKYSLFEFNDEFTRAQFVALVEPFLRDVKGRRGIYDYRVVCDTTNNTPEVIDSNRFVGDIYIKPARSINFIQLNFVAVRTGVEFSEIVGKF